MASGLDEDADVVLSDVEGDEHPITIQNPSPEEITVERFREILAERDRERQSREAAENSKSELQVSFNRLKALAHEAIKKRDECGRQRDEALREKEEALKLNEKVSAELAEANRQRDEALKLRDEITKEFDEILKDRDTLRSEIGNASHMLVTGIDKISAKVSSFKNFTAGGLPRSQKYTGLPAVAYGVIKRTNEIIEELVRQIDTTTKSRNETREQMELRNYEIAIEVSQLEATISGLKDEVSKKTSVIEDLENTIIEKDKKICENEVDLVGKLRRAEDEASDLRQLVQEYDDKLRDLESKMESQRPLLVDQLGLISKIHDQIYDIIKIVDVSDVDHSEFSESLFLPRETDMEENVRASLAGMESIYALAKLVMDKTRNLIEEKIRESKNLNETVAQLLKEKEHIGYLLRTALSKRMTSDPSSKANQLFEVAENGLREAGIDFKFSKLLGEEKFSTTRDNRKALDAEDEIFTLAGALENIVKASQIEIIELRHSLEELRAESVVLKERLESQSKELKLRSLQIQELEEKERVANESVEGLMMDVTAAEEEIIRWKVAAEQEAAAGKAVEQEFLAQISGVKQELEEARQVILDSDKKLKFKEETVNAAMAARDAAEKSLRLADVRASRLRERVEDLTRQLEQLDNREESRIGSSNGHRYVCWPWQWLGLDFVGSRHSETQQQESSNEMELSEPLI
ncbi:myosin heavy chain, non-muscle isoform X1 [Cucumis sativus]|uniref:Paramyosin n=1 Tax=Cucumis sativus TaxID=3659 RepID=A0A0A0KIP2_CUCSA|nr:myosin heavy chain, non-muscle isoform X1 [Cucumis sativus]XP_031741570.1 myosin heavy chain, non-muscle isoform X1 [Cucumis sativus]KGN49580.1 hypothetical protein Csa_018404 [Cucumis sativus]